MYGLKINIGMFFFEKKNWYRTYFFQGLILLVGEYYLQYLYSFLLCICMLLIITGCAPLGFMVLFDAVGHVLVKPKLFENDDCISTVKLEEVCLICIVNIFCFLYLSFQIFFFYSAMWFSDY